MEVPRGAPSLPPGWNESRPPRWIPRAVLYAAIGVGGFLVAKYLVVKLADLLIILLVSLFMSFAIEPAVDWMADRGWRRGAATGLVFVILLLVGSLLIMTALSYLPALALGPVLEQLSGLTL